MWPRTNEIFSIPKSQDAIPGGRVHGHTVKGTSDHILLLLLWSFTPMCWCVSHAATSWMNQRKAPRGFVQGFHAHILRSLTLKMLISIGTCLYSAKLVSVALEVRDVLWAGHPSTKALGYS